jgi:hypothetical protein
LVTQFRDLTIAVGDANSDEARVAATLAAVLKNTSSRLRLKIAFNTDNAKALTQYNRKQADLAVLRTDAKVPPRARALAILEHNVSSPPPSSTSASASSMPIRWMRSRRCRTS